MMTDLSPETVERMVALVRHATANATSYTQKLAAAIEADLPKPVDADWVEARKICRNQAQRNGDYGLASEYLLGSCDEQFEMQVALAAIKRGRTLSTTASDQGRG